MKYFFLALLISLSNITISSAQDYYLQNEKCVVHVFKRGKLEKVSSDAFLGKPLIPTKLKKNPEYLGFTVAGQVYIAPRNCLKPHVKTSTAPRPVAILPDKYYVEVESGIILLSDTRQIPSDYNLLFPSTSATTPTSWGIAGNSKYTATTLLQLGFGIGATPISYYTFKFKMFKGGKVDTVTLTNVNTATTQTKSWTYNDLFLNAYAGYKLFFVPKHLWKIMFGGYVGISNYSSELRDESNTTYQLKSTIMPVYMIEMGPEYRLDKKIALGMNVAYEYLGQRPLNTSTATNVKTLTSFNNKTITLDLKYFY